MSKRDKVKEKIVALVSKSGTAIRAHHLEGRVVLPANVELIDLLNELVAEGRLIRRFTLLNNGDTDRLYNLPRTPEITAP